MEPKVINKTFLDLKMMIKAQFLTNRFMSVIYGVFAVFFTIALFTSLSSETVLINQILFQALMVVFSLFISLIWPLLRSLMMYHKVKKNTKSDHQDLEYHFYDLYCRLIDHQADKTLKINYNSIQRIAKTKQMMIITFKGGYTVIDLGGFLRPNDKEKVFAWLKRAGKL